MNQAPQREPTETVETTPMTIAEAYEAARQGRVTTGPSALALFLCEQYVGLFRLGRDVGEGLPRRVADLAEQPQAGGLHLGVPVIALFEGDLLGQAELHRLIVLAPAISNETVTRSTFMGLSPSTAILPAFAG